MKLVILMCEDEPDLRDVLTYNLGSEGYDVRAVGTGRAALEALEQEPAPSLLLLDLMLPDMSGTEVCRRVRAHPRLSGLPLIMLTARADEIDRVVGFEVGADDYVVKPFSVRELLLRIAALLRVTSPRAPPPLAAAQRAQGPLALDPEGHRVWVEGKPVDLTPTELGVLTALLEREGRVLTTRALGRAGWGAGQQVTDRTVDMHLKRLRQKLGDAAEVIETVRGVGYRLRASRAPDS